MSLQRGRKTARLCLALIALVCATTAAAETVSLRYASPAAALVTQLNLPTGTRNYSVGIYTVQIENPPASLSFLAYCVDPFQFASASYQTYGKSSLGSFLAGSETRLADVTRLFAYAYAGTVGNATKAAGFQLALWEVFNDDKDLNNGSVRKTDRSHVDAVAEADSLLASLAASSWTTPEANYELTLFANGEKQDFLAAAPILVPVNITPVPEPETTALTLVGLGLLGLAGLRRRFRPASA